MEVADRFGVRRPQDALADVRAALDNWSDFAKAAGLSPSLKDRVAQDLVHV
jgi:serine/threonine-protein kinase HipA